MATPRAAGGRLVTLRPPISTIPSDAVSSPATIRRQVVLPQPDGPSRTVKLPGWMSIDTRSRAVAPPQWRLILIRRTETPALADRAREDGSSRDMVAVSSGKSATICPAIRVKGKSDGQRNRGDWVKPALISGAARGMVPPCPSCLVTPGSLASPVGRLLTPAHRGCTASGYSATGLMVPTSPCPSRRRNLPSRSVDWWQRGLPGRMSRSHTSWPHSLYAMKWTRRLIVRAPSIR